MSVNEPARNESQDSAEEALEMIVHDGGMDLFPAETRAEVERILAPRRSSAPPSRASPSTARAAFSSSTSTFAAARC
jgi:hypothetical protein